MPRIEVSEPKLKQFRAKSKTPLAFFEGSKVEQRRFASSGGAPTWAPFKLTIRDVTHITGAGDVRYRAAEPIGVFLFPYNKFNSVGKQK